MFSFIAGSAAIMGTYLLGKFKPEILLSFSSEVTLILCSVFILLYVAGLRDGLRYTGVAFVANIIIRAIFS